MVWYLGTLGPSEYGRKDYPLTFTKVFSIPIPSELYRARVSLSLTLQYTRNSQQPSASHTEGKVFIVYLVLNEHSNLGREFHETEHKEYFTVALRLSDRNESFL